MKIVSIDDLITLRFLLSLGTREFGDLIGVSGYKIESIEKGSSTLSRRYALAARYAVENAPNSKFIKRKYMELNRAEYVSFLRNLTNNPTTLPRFTPHRCCDAQDLEVSWEQGRDRTQATARCKTCMNRRPVKSIALMRTDLLQREYDLNLFTPELYSLPTWKGKRFRIDLTKLRKNTHQW